MGGGHENKWVYDGSKPYGGFHPTAEHKRGVGWGPRLAMAGFWFYTFYMLKHHGSHHFLRHHSWEDAENIQYLEEVDKRYGSKLSITNMGHHSHKGLLFTCDIPRKEQGHDH